ncbi:hypothetical protein RQP46_010739 [Phenoliferia psychrophenolica]
MPPSPQGSSGQPAIASFAPELIDEILHHLVLDLQWPLSRTEYPGPKWIQQYSLISRNWRGPVQRRLMRRLVIKSGKQAKLVAEGFVASGLDVYVKDLSIKFECPPWNYSAGTHKEQTSDQITAVDRVTTDHFLALLPHFPALVKLHLDGPPFAHFQPPDIINLETSKIWLRLTSLHIRTRRGDIDIDRVHAILSLTSSLTMLSLETWEYGSVKYLATRDPITLPHLKILKLEGRAFASSLLDLGLLSTSTIAQVTELFWYDDTSGSSAQPLLRLMGSSLHSLGYMTCDGAGRDMAAELQPCAVLERLDLDVFNGVAEGLLGSLPPTIHTLTFSDLRAAQELLFNNFAARSPSLKTVKLHLDFEDQYEEEDDSAEIERERFKDIVATLKDTGVELVVTGEDILKALEKMG